MEVIKIIDEEHIYYKGKQFISLNRFTELKNDQNKEMSILNDTIKTLVEENNAYKVLLKRELEKGE